MKVSLLTIRILLLLLFSTTFFDKVLDYDAFESQLFLSPLIQPERIHLIGIGTILAEGVVMALLLNSNTSGWGLLAAAFLLSLFGFYLWALIQYFGFKKPCGCGFIFSTLSYHQHIVINFVLSALAGAGYVITAGRRSTPGTFTK